MEPISQFDLAYEFTKKWEGGYVFDPTDPGGETNRGITDKRDGKTDGLVDVDANGVGDVSVKELTEEDAKTIYRRDYYDILSLDNRSVDWAVAIFDTCVNCGLARTALWLEDSQDVASFLEHRKKHYETLVQKRPALKKYLKGWMNRLDALHKYLAEKAVPESR